MIAVALSSLAGFADALGFLASGGFFVSFMSGNSTRLGVGLAFAPRLAAIAASLILAFVLGVTVASLLRRAVPARRAAVTVLLAAVTLTLAAVVHRIAPPLVTLALIAAAMGAENVAFAIGGDVIGLTYMTGTLVKIGQRIATALTGGDPWGWLLYALLWTSLISGGVLGALAYQLLALDALWVAAALTASLALILWRLSTSSQW
ncbi:DUF1275 family protein [Sphingomonas bacterium]|uniref:YoaK family protein n=1 Tax=Sphingomonas bacterium TaxID=1895847 RepID=UPI0026285972|nr:DUF1275 family protein [Sphingomonas bacterium]MDB5678305.1 hypothetical protein [Sphingomonas bacterium]